MGGGEERGEGEKGRREGSVGRQRERETETERQTEWKREREVGEREEERDRDRDIPGQSLFQGLDFLNFNLMSNR